MFTSDLYLLNKSFHPEPLSLYQRGSVYGNLSSHKWVMFIRIVSESLPCLPSSAVSRPSAPASPSRGPGRVHFPQAIQFLSEHSHLPKPDPSARPTYNGSEARSREDSTPSWPSTSQTQISDKLNSMMCAVNTKRGSARQKRQELQFCSFLPSSTEGPSRQPSTSRRRPRRVE